MVSSQRCFTCAALSPDISCKLTTLAPAERRDTRSSATRSITEDVNAVSRLTSEAEFAIKDGNMHQVPQLVLSQMLSAGMRLPRTVDNSHLLQALQKYTTIVKEYSDLALAERARIKRALMLYETGAVEQALLELEDEEVALRGNAEVHLFILALCRCYAS